MKKTILLIALQILLAQLVFGQTAVDDKDRMIRIPKENGVISLIIQPDCLLKIENAELLIDEDGKNPTIRYWLKNDSSKAIRYFAVAFERKYIRREWAQYGSGEGLGVGDESGKGIDLLLPGETYSNWRDEELEVVPMNEKVRNLLSSRNLGPTIISKESYEPKVKVFYVGLVSKVIFEDGTVYETKDLDNLSELLFP